MRVVQLIAHLTNATVDRFDVMSPSKSLYIPSSEAQSTSSRMRMWAL